MTYFPILILVVMLAAFWFMAIRPAKARQAKQRELINTLEPGQQVMTTAGIFGTVKALEGDIVVLEISPGVEIRIVKLAIAETKQEGLDDAHVLDQQSGIDTSVDETASAIEPPTTDPTQGR